LVATKGGLGYKPTVSPWSFFISQKTAGIIPHHIIESWVIILFQMQMLQGIKLNGKMILSAK
jgi:hypothetical protein